MGKTCGDTAIWRLQETDEREDNNGQRANLGKHSIDQTDRQKAAEEYGIGNERQIESWRKYLISMGFDKGHLGRWTYKRNVNVRRGEKTIETRSMQHGTTRYKQGGKSEWRN